MAAAASLKNNLCPRLSTNLSILDEHNTEFVVTLKTWQNVVSGQHRPTFVLENTSAFMDAHPMKPGDILAIVVTPENRLRLRTDMTMADLASTGVKRKYSNASATAAAIASGPVAATAATAAQGAQLKRRGSILSLKRNSSTISPSTPTPSSVEHNAKRLSAGTTTTTHSSADLAAATALMFLSSDTSSAFSLNKNDDTISSGLSGSSPPAAATAAALGESSDQLSMESHIEPINPISNNPLTRVNTMRAEKALTPPTMPASTIGKKQQQQKRKPVVSRQNSLPPPPLPAPFSCNTNPNLVSPFQNALLNYSVDKLPQVPADQEFGYCRQQEATAAAGTNSQRQRSQLSNAVVESNNPMAPPLTHDVIIKELMRREAEMLNNRSVVQQAGGSAFPSVSTMSHAAMVVANALHNYRMNQHHQQLAMEFQQQQQQQQQSAIGGGNGNNSNVMLVQNQQHGVAIRTASTEAPYISMAAPHQHHQHSMMPLAVGGGGQQISSAEGIMDALLRHFVY
jgi:hypothetical protein